jgi:hypothetical protein
VTTRPADKRPNARATSGNESLPVAGSSFLFTVTFFVLDITTAATVVVVVAATVVVVTAAVVVVGSTIAAGAIGVPFTVFELSESPKTFTALMVTE